MKYLSINHGLLTTTPPPSSPLSSLSTSTHSIPISIPKTHITNLNSSSSLSLPLFQSFILHTYKQTTPKSLSTFVIAYDLLENIENINTSSIPSHIPHFTNINSPSFFIPTINPNTNTYELYVYYNYQHIRSSTNKYKSSQSYNIIFAKNCINDKARLQQTHSFIMKQIDKLYEMFVNCNSNGSNSCGIYLNTSGGVTRKESCVKKVPLYMVNYPPKCSEYESGLLSLKICISSIKSINVGWYLNTIIHTKIDNAYMEGIKTKFITELKQQLNMNINTTPKTPKNTIISPMIYNRKINLSKPATNLIRRETKVNIPSTPNSTYKKKVIHRCSSGEHSFTKTLSDLTTIKEFTSSPNTSITPSPLTPINTTFNSTIHKQYKQHRDYIYQYTNNNTTAITTEIDSYNNVSESKQSRNKCNSVKLRNKHRLEQYAYLLAHKPSVGYNVSSCSGSESSVNGINISKYTSDVIEFTEDDERGDTLEEFNVEGIGRKRKGITKIPKPKLRESVILYRGGSRHPSYENKMRGGSCLGEDVKCGGNHKNECVVF